MHASKSIIVLTIDIESEITVPKHSNLVKNTRNRNETRDGSKTYPILVDNVDDDDEFPIFFPVIDECHAPDLDVTFKHLTKSTKI